jgi:hypothetical protein
MACVDPGGGGPCGCVPTGAPCGTLPGGGPPMCFGGCPNPGQACIDFGGMCACDEPGPPPPCGAGTSSPSCDGACGPGMMCADPGGGCMCVPTAGPCGAGAPFPVCLGDVVSRRLPGRAPRVRVPPIGRTGQVSPVAIQAARRSLSLGGSGA